MNLDSRTVTTNQIRDLTHNIDMSCEKDIKIFTNFAKQYIKMEEGYMLEAYDDYPKRHGEKRIRKLLSQNKPILGNITIGVGFNMDDKGAEKEWRGVFGDSISFEDARLGKEKLTEEQVDNLLHKPLQTRYNELQNIYGEAFKYLRANELIAILSAYYTSPKTVGYGTNFRKHMINYVCTRQKEYLLKAVEELRDRSNPSGVHCDRRQREATILNSTLSPFYVLPRSGLLPKKLPQIKLGETIIPVNISRILPGVKNPDYFIWRTEGDSKVRPDHEAKNGRIFKRSEENLPGNDYNYRCHAEEVPAILPIIEDTIYKNLGAYLRYSWRNAYIL